MSSAVAVTAAEEAIHEGPPPPVQMVQLLAGFQVAQALYVVAKLNVATALRDGPRSVEELTDSTGAAPAALARLLRSLASLGVLAEAEPGVYALTPLGATLATGTPGSVRDLALTWMETHYAPFGRLLDGVMSAEPAASLYYGKPFFEWLSSDREQVQRFTGAMANLTEAIRIHAMADYRLPAAHGWPIWAGLTAASCAPCSLMTPNRGAGSCSTCRTSCPPPAGTSKAWGSSNASRQWAATSSRRYLPPTCTSSP